ncbi:DUF2256 domain-containing protein [Pseudomonas sp.]|uniref:DUF2256 domain-containing protein n=1 Tax=Pseudomonas sp. TaxID=306 RepID=UPI0028A83B16|nr:DUF2256 domain-containing protein [Pseudomonas sp.]
MCKPLPSNVCPVFGLPFSWRTRWARCSDQVRYCSERCRRSARRAVQPRLARPMSPSCRTVLGSHGRCKACYV